MRTTIATLALLLLAAPAWAQSTFTLKPGPGRNLTQSSCGACHTPGYIQMNSPFLTENGWKVEVTKMRTAFGAPIDDAQANEIIQYLTAHYAVPSS
jgi:mono/diheme cytochrome c family protein